MASQTKPIIAPLMSLRGQDIDDFFANLNNFKGRGEYLQFDLSRTTFIPAEGVLALLNAARLWHDWTGNKISLCQLQRPVHQYLERADLFSKAAEWIKCESVLPQDEHYARSSASVNLMELTYISSSEETNADNVTEALNRARRILNGWFDNTKDVANLLSILSEIATNIVHSRDQGFAIIQRYRGELVAGSRVTIAIADLGIGIENSLSLNPSRLKVEAIDQLETGSDFILQALKLGVTSRGQVAGVGLHQVRSIVDAWRGSLVIRSQRSKVQFFRGDATVWDELTELPGTQVTIDVQGGIELPL